MAFPSTPILDDFNRADGSPGANWSANILAGFTEFTISSNTLSAGAAFKSNYWNSALAADQEVYCKITTMGGAASPNALVARLVSPNDDPNVDYYMLAFDSTNSYLFKHVNTVETQLGGNLGVAFVANDLIGLRCSGSTIEAWHKPSAGPWTLIGSQVDTAITTGGFVGIINENNASFAIDDFGGGSLGSSQLTTLGVGQ